MGSPPEAELAAAVGAASIQGLERLSGGASRETWRFDAERDDGSVEPLILRRDPPGRPSVVGMMTAEATAARVCSEAGLRVPGVLVSSEAPSPWETAGYVMRRIEGETLARRILRDDEYAHAREVLVQQCGEFLRGLHSLPVDSVPGLEAADPVAVLRRNLSLAGEATPTMELAFRWLEANRPPTREHVIVHGDFRLGNLIVDRDGLAAVLDWELLHIGNPVEDLGWLCTKAWRFGAALPVGGFATREALLEAYGGDVTLDELRWWEVLGTLKWAIGCMGQGAVHLRGQVRSVELAAIGRRVCEQEWDLLLLLCPEVAERHRSTTGTVAAPSALHGRPTAAELAEALEEFLRDEVMPGTTGRLSFQARVAANVAAMIKREIELGASLEAGLGSGTEEERLAAQVAAKLAVANPGYLRSH